MVELKINRKNKSYEIYYRMKSIEMIMLMLIFKKVFEFQFWIRIVKTDSKLLALIKFLKSKWLSKKIKKILYNNNKTQINLWR